MPLIIITIHFAGLCFLFGAALFTWFFPTTSLQVTDLVQLLTASCGLLLRTPGTYKCTKVFNIHVSCLSSTHSSLITGQWSISLSSSSSEQQLGVFVWMNFVFPHLEPWWNPDLISGSQISSPTTPFAPRNFSFVSTAVNQIKSKAMEERVWTSIHYTGFTVF